MEDKRKRYKCDCKCGKTFYATKSLLQCMGMLECGYGRCLYCKTLYNLTLDEENKRMILTPWNEYVKKQKNET